jgi:putative membrane protein
MRPFHAFAMTCLLGLSLAAAPAAAQTSAGGQAGTQGQTGTTGQSGEGGMTAGQTGDTSASQSGRMRQDDPQKFVEKAAISNMAEIQLSQLAQQRAQDPDVKQFAQMMVDEHTKAQNELQQAASASNYTIPASLDSKHQKTYDKLSNLNGGEFDRAYMKAMVKAHEDTAKLLEKRVGKSNTYGSTGTSGTSGTAGTSGTSTSGSTSGSTTGAVTGTGETGATQGSQGSVGTSGSPAAPMSIDSWAAQTLPSVQQHLQHAKDLEKRVKNESKNDKNDRHSRY